MKRKLLAISGFICWIGSLIILYRSETGSIQLTAMEEAGVLVAWLGSSYLTYKAYPKA